MNLNDNVIINENLKCFYKSFNLCITFDTLLIEFIKTITLKKRSFVLIKFNKIKIYSIWAIEIDILSKSVEINNKDKRFEYLFN